jgi:hypothetical protein
MDPPDSYVVAIPTYRRRTALASKTLPLLLARGVDPQRITIVVADLAEADSYRAVLLPGTYGRISVASVTLRSARHHIAALYPDGTPVVQIDDDVSDVVEAVDKKTLRPVPNLDRMFRDAFTTAADKSCYLWGVAPVPNAFYLNPGKASAGLKFCIGTLFGWWSRGPHHTTQRLYLDEKEDYERTLRFYDHDGQVLRLDGVSIKTRHYEEPGGMQEYRTVQDSHFAAAYLQSQWPQYVHINTKRTGPRTEILLRARKRTSMEAPA